MLNQSIQNEYERNLPRAQAGAEPGAQPRWGASDGSAGAPEGDRAARHGHAADANRAAAVASGAAGPAAAGVGTSAAAGAGARAATAAGAGAGAAVGSGRAADAPPAAGVAAELYGDAAAGFEYELYGGAERNIDEILRTARLPADDLHREAVKQLLGQGVVPSADNISYLATVAKKIEYIAGNLTQETAMGAARSMLNGRGLARAGRQAGEAQKAVALNRLADSFMKAAWRGRRGPADEYGQDAGGERDGQAGGESANAARASGKSAKAAQVGNESADAAQADGESANAARASDAAGVRAGDEGLIAARAGGEGLGAAQAGGEIAESEAVALQEFSIDLDALYDALLRIRESEAPADARLVVPEGFTPLRLVPGEAIREACGELFGQREYSQKELAAVRMMLALSVPATRKNYAAVLSCHEKIEQLRDVGADAAAIASRGGDSSKVTVDALLAANNYAKSASFAKAEAPALAELETHIRRLFDSSNIPWDRPHADMAKALLKIDMGITAESVAAIEKIIADKDAVLAGNSEAFAALLVKKGVNPGGVALELLGGMQKLMQKMENIQEAQARAFVAGYRPAEYSGSYLRQSTEGLYESAASAASLKKLEGRMAELLDGYGLDASDENIAACKALIQSGIEVSRDGVERLLGIREKLAALGAKFESDDRLRLRGGTVPFGEIDDLIGELKQSGRLAAVAGNPDSAPKLERIEALVDRIGQLRLNDFNAIATLMKNGVEITLRNLSIAYAAAGRTIDAAAGETGETGAAGVAAGAGRTAVAAAGWPSAASAVVVGNSNVAASSVANVAEAGATVAAGGAMAPNAALARAALVYADAVPSAASEDRAGATATAQAATPTQIARPAQAAALNQAIAPAQATALTQTAQAPATTPIAESVALAQPAQATQSAQPAQSAALNQALATAIEQLAHVAESAVPLQPEQAITPEQTTASAQATQLARTSATAPITESAALTQSAQATQAAQPAQATALATAIERLVRISESVAPAQPEQTPATAPIAESTAPAQPEQALAPTQTTAPAQATQAAQPAQSAALNQALAAAIERIVGIAESTAHVQATQFARASTTAPIAESVALTQPAQATAPAQQAQVAQPSQATAPVQTTQTAQPAQSAALNQALATAIERLARVAESAAPAQPEQAGASEQASTTATVQATAPSQSAQPSQATTLAQATQSAQPAQATALATAIERIVRIAESVAPAQPEQAITPAQAPATAPAQAGAPEQASATASVQATAPSQSAQPSQAPAPVQAMQSAQPAQSAALNQALATVIEQLAHIAESIVPAQSAQTPATVPIAEAAAPAQPAQAATPAQQAQAAQDSSAAPAQATAPAQPAQATATVAQPGQEVAPAQQALATQDSFAAPAQQASSAQQSPTAQDSPAAPPAPQAQASQEAQDCADAARALAANNMPVTRAAVAGMYLANASLSAIAASARDAGFVEASAYLYGRGAPLEDTPTLTLASLLKSSIERAKSARSAYASAARIKSELESRAQEAAIERERADSKRQRGESGGAASGSRGQSGGSRGGAAAGQGGGPRGGAAGKAPGIAAAAKSSRGEKTALQKQDADVSDARINGMRKDGAALAGEQPASRAGAGAAGGWFPQPWRGGNGAQPGQGGAQWPAAGLGSEPGLAGGRAPGAGAGAFAAGSAGGAGGNAGAGRGVDGGSDGSGGHGSGAGRGEWGLSGDYGPQQGAGRAGGGEQAGSDGQGGAPGIPGEYALSGAEAGRLGSSSDGGGDSSLLGSIFEKILASVAQIKDMGMQQLACMLKGGVPQDIDAMAAARQVMDNTYSLGKGLSSLEDALSQYILGGGRQAAFPAGAPGAFGAPGWPPGGAQADPGGDASAAAQAAASTAAYASGGAFYSSAGMAAYAGEIVWNSASGRALLKDLRSIREILPSASLKALKEGASVSDIYNDIRGRLSQLESRLLKMGLKQDDPISRIISSMKDNMRAQEQLSKNQLCFQIPFLYNQKPSSLTVFVQERRRGAAGKRADGDLSVDLSLETESLGMVSIGMSVSDRLVDIDIAVSNRGVKDYLGGITDKLGERIGEAGFKVGGISCGLKEAARPPAISASRAARDARDARDARRAGTRAAQRQQQASASALAARAVAAAGQKAGAPAGSLQAARASASAIRAGGRRGVDIRA